MPIKLNTASGGGVILTGANTASDKTITIPAADTTMVGTDSTQTLTNKTIQGGVVTSGTAVSSTSGTAIDFTGIPSWAKRITVMLNGVSTNGSSNYVIQIGSGSVTASGYTSSCANITTTPTLSTSTAAFLVNINATAGETYIGHAVITLVNGFTWVMSGTVARYSAGNMQVSAGAVTLGGALDRVRIGTAGGTDTFDAGSINILYEG